MEASAVCGRRCTVDATGTDTHTVVATNRSLITWDVTIEGECTTSDIEYHGLGRRWPAWTVTVPGRPGKGGKMVVSQRQALASLHPDPHQIVRTDMHVCETGKAQAAADTLWLQVATT